MDIKGKLIQKLPLQTGEGKNGPWKKQEIVLEIPGQYPKKLMISIWGDKINEALLNIGNELNVSFDLESREYNGRWYTDVKAWKVESAGAGTASTPPPASSNNDMGYVPPMQAAPPMVDEDDLPF